MRIALFALTSGLIWFGGTESIQANQTAERFSQTNQSELELNYLLSLPEGYDEDKNKEWPLLVFLHGSGERGTNLENVKVHGPPKLVAEGQSFPFIVASPQCPLNHYWDSQPVLELVDELERKYRVDKRRIYLTGLSMGGYGAWHFAMEAPDRFAAIAPMCGGGLFIKLRFITHLPVWAFHGAQDQAVPLEETTRLIATLKAMGNEFVRMTVNVEAAHDCWTDAYNNPELYDWFLANSIPVDE